MLHNWSAVADGASGNIKVPGRDGYGVDVVVHGSDPSSGLRLSFPTANRWLRSSFSGKLEGTPSPKITPPRESSVSVDW